MNITWLNRVLAGLHDNIELSFMIVGLTPFAPDGNEGLIRKCYRRSNIYTYEDLVQTILNSSENGHNICQPGGSYGEPNASQPLIYRNWSSWLTQAKVIEHWVPGTHVTMTTPPHVQVLAEMIKTYL